MGITLPAPEIFSLSETHLHFLVPTRRDRTNCGICHVNGGTKALVITSFFFFLNAVSSLWLYAASIISRRLG